MKIKGVDKKIDEFGWNRQLLLDRGYTGHEHLYTVGLVHMNGRIYDPKLRRFLSPDNFVQDNANTQNYNRYGYVLNNPLLYIDPSGEELLTAVIVGAAVAVVSTVIINISLDIPIWYGIGKATVMGAASGAASYGIGAAVKAAELDIIVQAGMHGVSGGVMSELDGGTFVSGFASGVIASLVGSGVGSLGPEGSNLLNSNLTKGAIIVGGGIAGGLSSSIAGGDFWKGMQQGLITGGLNHIMHMVVDNGYDEAGNKINGNGGDVMDIRYDDDGNVLEIRDVEVRFWERVGAVSDLPLEEFGVRRLKMATGQVTSVGGAFDIFGFKELFFGELANATGSPVAGIALSIFAKKGIVNSTNAIKSINNLPKGFIETKQFGYQHGQKVYKYKGKYYSPDVGSGNGLGSHNGGVWKVFEVSGNKLKRIGTANKDLKIFKD